MSLEKNVVAGCCYTAWLLCGCASPEVSRTQHGAEPGINAVIRPVHVDPDEAGMPAVTQNLAMALLVDGQPVWSNTRRWTSQPLPPLGVSGLIDLGGTLGRGEHTIDVDIDCWGAVTVELYRGQTLWLSREFKSPPDPQDSDGPWIVRL